MTNGFSTKRVWAWIPKIQRFRHSASLLSISTYLQTRRTGSECVITGLEPDMQNAIFVKRRRQGVMVCCFSCCHLDICSEKRPARAPRSRCRRTICCVPSTMLASINQRLCVASPLSWIDVFAELSSEVKLLFSSTVKSGLYAAFRQFCALMACSFSGL